MPSIISSSYVQNLIRVAHSLSVKNSIILDWQKTQSIEASGYSLLSVILDKAKETGTSIKNINISNSLHHPIWQKPNPSIRLATEEHFKETQNSINVVIDGGFSPYFSTLFADKFSHLSPQLIFHGQLILNELLQNASDHSGSERYYMYAEESLNRLCLGILDCGVGIPAKLSQKYYRPSDDEYINYSFKEGVSTRRLRQGGYGLYHTFKITQGYEGNLVVLSHDGGIRRYFAQRKVVRLNLKNTLPGTWCFIEIKAEKKND